MVDGFAVAVSVGINVEYVCEGLPLVFVFDADCQPGIVAVCFVESLGCCVGCSVSLACECVAVGAVFNDLFGCCLEGAFDEWQFDELAFT